MNIVSIKESGCNNILRWSIEKGANIYSDIDLQAIVNEELFYLVTMSDVNFLELFRLTQLYRDKLRIVKEDKADVPPRSVLAKMFNGKITTGKGTDDEKSISMAEAVEFVCQNFINMVLQMQSDSDIVSSTALRLFLPMLTRRFTVQIPFGFVDLIKSITVEEAPEIFNSNYPETLSTLIDNSDHTFQKIFNLGFIKTTEILRYNKTYDKYLNVFKYQNLKPKTDDVADLFNLSLLGFHCINNLSRGELRCSMFNADKDTLTKSMAEFKNVDLSTTPIYFDFAIELPIQYMQILCNAFSREVLTISYESSMATIIDGGLSFNDFIIPEFKGDEDLTEDQQKEVDNAKNSIDAYRIRITEANQILMNTLEAILNDEKADISVTDTFAMIPCIYKAKAVISVDTSLIDSYTKHPDAVLSKMFAEINNIVSSVLSDIKSINTKEK